MSARNLSRVLRSAHRGKPVADAAVRHRLEEDLLLEHRRVYGKRVRRRPPVLLRPALALPAFLVVIVGVGAIPASYPVPAGSILTAELAPGTAETPKISELLTFLEASGAADELSVSVSQRRGEGARLMLMLFGDRIPEQEVVDLLRDRYPVLADARIIADELVGTIRSSLAERLGRALFAVEVSAADVEQARRQILEELAAGGYRGARVDVRDDGEQREIDVELD